MQGTNRNGLEEFAAQLPLLFYALLSVSLLALAAGSPGSGFLLLALAGCTHVLRVGAEAAVAPQRAIEPRLNLRSRTR
jgi:hypothetical protein